MAPRGGQGRVEATVQPCSVSCSPPPHHPAARAAGGTRTSTPALSAHEREAVGRCGRRKASTVHRRGVVANQQEWGADLMAHRSKIAKQAQHRVVARSAPRREERKQLIAAPGTVPGDRQAAVSEPRRRPRDTGATRLRNRGALDGRPRGYLRAFGVSRIRLRELAHGEYLPGVGTSSW